MQKTSKTASELEQIIAKRFGPVVQVTVRGKPPDWDAVLIDAGSQDAERIATFRILVLELRREFELGYPRPAALGDRAFISAPTKGDFARREC